MSQQIVRNLYSNETHLADVGATTAATQFGAVYRQPPTDTRAFCGVHISNGVVMRAGSKVRCSACHYLGEQRAAEGTADEYERQPLMDRDA